MAEPNRPFHSASKEQFKEYARLSANSRRTPELKKAWEDRELIIQRNKNGEWASDLAVEYKIPKRAMYRILEKIG